MRPCNPRLINPASVDLCLGGTFRDFYNPVWIHPIRERIKLFPDYTVYKWVNRLSALLGDVPAYPTYIMAITYEFVKLPTNLAGEVKMKTTPTREGLAQVIADWVDPGYEGRLTLILHAIKPVEISYKERICQLVLMNVDGDTTSYAEKGHYMHQNHPTLSWRN